MSNLDDSIGKILLELQKDDPDTFKKLMKKLKKNTQNYLMMTLMQKTKKLMNIISK
jgi:hypothetical protein